MPYPDFGASVDTVAAGVQEWTSGPLCDGIWCFGFRVYNGTYEEPNTHTFIYLRIEDGAIVSRFPPTPTLVARNISGGRIQLICHADVPIGPASMPTKCKFFTNDGAGGDVDYATPLGNDYVTMVELNGEMVGTYTTDAYAETERIFGCIAYTSGSVASLQAEEASITPDSTPPEYPEGIAISQTRH